MVQTEDSDVMPIDSALVFFTNGKFREVAFRITLAGCSPGFINRRNIYTFMHSKVYLPRERRHVHRPSFAL